MELLLNLLWLVLAIPAVFIWRREWASAGRSSRGYRSRSFILLGCLLALLFPVVSATDDLHAMCQEAEEAGPSKRIVKQCPGAKATGLDRGDISPAALIRIDSFSPAMEESTPVFPLSFFVPFHVCSNTVGSRAPPLSAVS